LVRFFSLSMGPLGVSTEALNRRAARKWLRLRAVPPFPSRPAIEGLQKGVATHMPSARTQEFNELSQSVADNCSLAYIVPADLFESGHMAATLINTSLSPARILVVDDDQDILQAARLFLRRHFAIVETLRDPVQLPDLVRQSAFDVLLLDMNFAGGRDDGGEG